MPNSLGPSVFVPVFKRRFMADDEIRKLEEKLKASSSYRENNVRLGSKYLGKVVTMFVEEQDVFLGCLSFSKGHSRIKGGTMKYIICSGNGASIRAMNPNRLLRNDNDMLTCLAHGCAQMCNGSENIDSQ